MSRGGRVSVWEKERRMEYLEEKGMKTEEVVGRRERGEHVAKFLVEKKKEMQERERTVKVGESRWNKWYGWVK